MTATVRVCRDVDAFAEAAARLFVAAANEAIADHGRFSVALAGGSTPRVAYTRIASDETARVSLSWRQIDWWWSDERTVPPRDPESNFRMATESLISHVPIDPARVHRLKGEIDPAQAAQDYERELRAALAAAPPAIPRFDLILLGLGGDGHTASLFPGSAAVDERDRLVVANPVASQQTTRLTFTLPLINHARRVVFLVTGESKAAILARVIDGPAGVFPAQLVTPADGELLWLVDNAAASQLGAT